MSPELTVFKVLGEALALGLLVGAERYRGRDPGEKQSAGVRTFAIVCLLGAVCGLLGTVAFTTITFAAIAGLVLVGYWRSPTDSLGTTTELAAMLVFWIGYLLNSLEAAAVSLGIVLTIFLASKRTLHNFVKDQISEAEFDSTLKFLAVVLVIYPILPDRELGPWGFFNPSQVWGFVILVSTISYAGYFLVRWLGKRRGLMLSSLAGGIVSTTAVTLTLADRARQAPQASRLFGVVAVLANAVQGPRLVLLVWIVNRDLALSLAGPLLGMAVAGLAGSWLLSRRLQGQVDVDFPLRNPYSIWPALKFGLFFVGILLLVEAARFGLGDRGILLASAIGGLGSTSAVALSVSELLGQGSLSPLVATGSILAAVTAGVLSKWTLSLINGTRQMAFWLGGGLLTMLATAFVVLYVQS